MVKTAPGPFKISVKRQGKTYSAVVQLVNPTVKYSLQDTFHSHLSANKQQFNDRIYVQIPLPKGVTEVSEVSVKSATAGGKSLRHELMAHAVEIIDGHHLLHVQVDFPTSGYQISEMRSSRTKLIILFR